MVTETGSDKLVNHSEKDRAVPCLFTTGNRQLLPGHGLMPKTMKEICLTS